MSQKHELSDDCWCGPTVIPVEREDGSVGWNYAHHEHGQTPADEAERAVAIVESISEQQRDTE